MHKIPFKTQALVNQGAGQTDKSDHVRLLRDGVRQMPKRRINAPRRLRAIAKSDSCQEPAVIANSPDANRNKSVVHDARLEKSQFHMIRLAEPLFGRVIPPIHRFQPLVSVYRAVDTELPHAIHRIVSLKHKVNNTVKRVLSASPDVHSGVKSMLSASPQLPDEFMRTSSRTDEFRPIKIPDEFMRTSSRTDEFRPIKNHDEFMRTSSRTDQVRSVRRSVSTESRRELSISPDSLCAFPPGRHHHTVGAQAHDDTPSPHPRSHNSYSPDFWDGDGRTCVDVMSRIQRDFLRFHVVAKKTGLYSKSFI